MEKVANTVMLPVEQYDSMVEALQWYADFSNWRRVPRKAGKSCKAGYHKPSALIDRGSRAAFILTLVKP